jgi:hypothetical protein
MIVGLCGLAGSGKDSVAEVLEAKLGFKRASFAEDIRNALYTLNPIIGRRCFFWTVRLQDAVDRLGWDVAKRRYPEIRRLMQVLGTEVGREQFGQRFWLDRTFSHFGIDDDVAISDVRMQNEVDAIQESGGFIIWVKRPGLARMAHKSEQLDFEAVCDAIILNDGSKKDLEVSTLECMEALNALPTNLF